MGYTNSSPYRELSYIISLPVESSRTKALVFLYWPDARHGIFCRHLFILCSRFHLFLKFDPGDPMPRYLKCIFEKIEEASGFQ